MNVVITKGFDGGEIVKDLGSGFTSTKVACEAIKKEAVKLGCRVSPYWSYNSFGERKATVVDFGSHQYFGRITE